MDQKTEAIKTIRIYNQTAAGLGLFAAIAFGLIVELRTLDFLVLSEISSLGVLYFASQAKNLQIQYDISGNSFQYFLYFRALMLALLLIWFGVIFKVIT